MSNVMEGYYDDLNSQESKIETVAIYARKSRAEEGEKDLNNHLMRLKARSELNNWSYEVYKEIGSGGSIDDRPMMKQLLKDVEKGEFDAVVVVDLDRLSRGKGADLDRILGTFRNNDVKIVQESPYEVYDLTNSDHAQMLEMKMFFGNMELMQTKKRFREGRRLSRHLGKWVYGQPPFGYQIDKKTKKLIVNEREKEAFIKMKEMFFDGYNTVDIAWNLNKEGYTKRSGRPFESKSISRILKNEIYTGTTVYNKSVGSKRNNNSLYSSGLPFKRLEKTEWKRKYNTHPALLTMEEHKTIVEHFQNSPHRAHSRSKVPYSLSGLCRTPEGEQYHIYTYNSDNKPTHIGIKKTKFEEKSKYISVPIKLVESVILESIKMLESELELLLEDNDNQKEVALLEKRAKKISREIEQLESEIDRIQEGFLAGLFNAEEAAKIKKKKNSEVDEKENELLEVNKNIDKVSSSTNLTRLDRLQNIYKMINDSSNPEKLNEIYKSIINDIVVSRTVHDEIDVQVNFL
ncbi:recombinase family protein [Staphylococcus chromogenes]|uniref:recombinase family protein n=1 Tax=Staphylococcus chromogenes TaxID=46126 RepID=UPI00288396E3|nr:recombinase family protein [Staphylococcus chromogenes]MDT0700316.1 recombinase family protein [Staphylococcus chromogenes]